MDISDVIKRRLEWMESDDRTGDLYMNGVQEFLDFAFTTVASSSDLEEDEIRVVCPCKKCNNNKHKTRQEIFDDLLINGIVPGYVRWVYHGEHTFSLKRSRGEINVNEKDDILTMIQEIREPVINNETQQDGDDCGHRDDDFHLHSESSKLDNKIEDLMQKAQEVLYPGCDKVSKLSFILELFQIKCMEGMTNKAFTRILQMFKKVLPEGTDVPKSYYEARKLITDFGFDYEKIEVYENNCMLFWKDDSNLERCRICGKERDKLSPKVLQYYPLTPRLQRLFMSSKTSEDMRWHSDVREDDDDGVLTHPADTKAWAELDKCDDFGSESRNVRLGLASDGFNPFGGLRSEYSIWPVVVVVYNLPPWMCMKQPYTVMSLLIPGKSAPGNNIDVYLRPLVEELKELWDKGIKTYDASKKEYFKMRAGLLWTINDFPAYANLSGWSTKGYQACPWCMTDTPSKWLPNCSKLCYMDHRRFLDVDHKWRDSKSFNGKTERRERPTAPTGVDVLEQVKDMEDMNFGKTQKIPKRDDNWKKKSIFFELPYWSKLLIRHNLDVMHIEKNVCDSILGTLLDIEKKTKDGIKARHDLKIVNIMKHLAPKKVNEKWHIPPAAYTLSRAQKEKVLKFLEELKVPDGYSSNISNCINLDKRRIFGLKSHDCHVILEQLLPFAIRGVSETKVYEVIAKLSLFFKDLCSKELRMKDLEHLDDHIKLILCEMEKIFLPSFFDIMVHLCVHLAEEAKIAGPVHYRWMYPIERLLRRFKCYVRNKSRPEGSIAEGYILEECMYFCSKYLSGDIETKFNQLERNADVVDEGYKGLSIFASSGKPLGSAKLRCLTNEEILQAQAYVLDNCEEARPYVNEYKESGSDVNLVDWFRARVGEFSEDNNQMTADLRSLGLGPSAGVQCYTRYVANGFRFHTKEYGQKRRNQNSGVMVDGEDTKYYGVLTEIISLQYLKKKRVILFRCDWYDVHDCRNGVKTDKFGFVSVNSRRQLKTKEPFVLLSQARQVFYAKDGFDPNWLVVIKTNPRHHYNVREKEVVDVDDEVSQQIHSRLSSDKLLNPIFTADETLTQRNDIDNDVVDATPENEPKLLDEIENEDVRKYFTIEDEESDTDDDYGGEEIDEHINLA